MKRAIATACALAALALPAAPAGASPSPRSADSPVHVSLCPTGSVGVIVWTTDPTTGGRLDLVYACVLIVQ